MERNLLIAELNRLNLKDFETKALVSKTSKLIWKRNTQLGAPYVGGNFNFLYNPGATEAIITFVTNVSYRSKHSNAEKTIFEDRLKDAVAAWDGAAELQIRNSSGNIATRIKLRFKLQIVKNSKLANKKTDVHPNDTWASWFSGKNREIVMRNLNVYIGSTYKTLCHELGHVWGLEDEYDTKWVEKKFSPAHVGVNSPLLKDTTAMMNIGDNFRGRYFKHFSRAILKSFAHIPEFTKPIKSKGKTIAYQVVGQIALLKKGINGGIPGNFNTLNPQFTPVVHSFRNTNKEISINSDFDSEVFLPDDRIKVRDEKLKPYSWVCKIRVRYIDPKTKQGGWSEGTGILVAPTCVLTNAHVILPNNKPGSHTHLDKIEVIIGLNDSKKIAGPFITKSYQIHPNFGKERPDSKIDFNMANSIWDYGVIKLNIPAKEFKYLGNYRHWGHTTSESLTSIGRDKLNGIEGKSAGYKTKSSIMLEAKGKLDFFNNLPPKYADRLIAHEIDTEFSQSGSPVWIEATTEGKAKIPILAGIHVLGNKNFNVAIRVSEEVLTEINKMKLKLSKIR